MTSFRLNCFAQELGNTWDKIEQMASQDKELIVVSRNIKTELGGFYKKVDESSQLTSEDHRGYSFIHSFIHLFIHSFIYTFYLMRTKKDPEVTNVSHNTRKFVHETTVKK